MSGTAGPTGILQDHFDHGLRFLATALALASSPHEAASQSAAISAACDAVKCFLCIFAEAARRRMPDPKGELARLRDQCEALLNPDQSAANALVHALEAARLARDEAARLLPRMLQSIRPASPE